MDDNCNIATSKKNASRRRPGPRFTSKQRKEAQEKFLKSFASNGNVRVACLAAGVDRSTIHRWAEHDEQFSMRYNLAKADVDDAIRAEIYRRGMYGDEEPLISMGRPVLGEDGKPIMVRRKSDILLMFHAKARMPEYRDKQPIDHADLFPEQAAKAKDDLLADLLTSLSNENKEQNRSDT